MDLKLSGDVGEAISVAAGFGMGGTGGTDLTRVRASGPSNLIFRAGFPVKQKLAPGSVDFEVEGSVVGGTFTNLPLKADARDVEIRFAADRNGFWSRVTPSFSGCRQKSATRRRRDGTA